ncbi:MAG: hypothetical protein ACK4MM_02765 [Fervidobacterium sp.]
MDPGEPGIPSGAPASKSILRVLSQELANYMDFKKQAMENGGFIIAGGIFLDLQKRGSFLAAVAGKTKVWMYFPGNKTDGTVPNNGDSKGQNGLDGINDSDNGMKQSKIQEKIDELYRKMAITDDPLEREKLQEQILLLTMAMNALAFGLKMPGLLVGMILNTVV